MSTPEQPMNPPTMRELCDAATKGPIAFRLHDDGGWEITSKNNESNGFVIAQRTQWHRKKMSHANASLHARLDPDAMLKVLDALEDAHCHVLINGDDRTMAPVLDKIERVINLLNGITPEKPL